MLLGGDELGRTQGGNNNAYCQDNPTSWYDWDAVDDELLDFCRHLIRFRLAHPVFCRRRFFEGRPIWGTDLSDISWFRPDGKEMQPQDWQVGFAKSLMVFLNGEALPDPDPRGQPVRDDSFLVLLNAHRDTLAFTLPGRRWGRSWSTEIDTAGAAKGRRALAGSRLDVPGLTLRVLRRP